MKTTTEVRDRKSEVSHTPGPWGVIDNGGDVRPEAIYAPEAGGYIVATTWAIVREPQRKANARLIAAAPELLAALEKCEAWLSRIREEDENLVIDHSEDGFGLIDARAAIQKARGC